MSFAFGQREAILDTNVARVLFRIFVGRGAPKAHAMKRHLWDVSRTVLPHRHVFDFNQALMDFGATLCTARKPKCLICPMQAGCKAFPFNPDNEPRPARAGHDHRRHGGDRRGPRPLFRDETPEGRRTSRACGNSPAARSSPANRSRTACGGS